MFRRDRDSLLARAKEASKVRIWAGIHTRTDIDVGQKMGGKVAARVLERGVGLGRH